MKEQELFILISKKDIQILKYALNHFISTTGQSTEYDELLRKLYSLETLLSKTNNERIDIQNIATLEGIKI